MEYYDNLETQDQKTRTEVLREALPVQIQHAKDRSAAYAKLLADVDSSAIDSIDALAQLPVTRKSELQALQQQSPPLGGIATLDQGRVTRIYQSPGPIYEPEARRPDYWRIARALFAAGFRSGQFIHNTFSYHFTPAGFMFDSGARALGCPVFPAGVGQTELQVKAINDLKPSGYAGTPSFLKIILEKAAELKIDVSSLKRALVGGEALPPSLRSEFKNHGLDVYQCYATADLGLIAYESPACEGLISDEGVLIEIVRPGSGDPVPDGEVGELLVTTFNPEYPLIRFATGDLSAIMPGESPCGRTNKRIEGWLGRADQTTKVRGMFIHPSQVADVLKRHPEINKGRLVVDSQDHADVMTLRCELTGNPPEELAAALADSIREVCKLRGGVEFVAPGSLPNDGKIIDDTRSYE
jgi:phenylacetate-CoA ligase